jgi:hypothetical protein
MDTSDWMHRMMFMNKNKKSTTVIIDDSGTNVPAHHLTNVSPPSTRPTFRRPPPSTGPTPTTQILQIFVRVWTRRRMFLPSNTLYLSKQQQQHIKSLPHRTILPYMPLIAGYPEDALTGNCTALSLPTPLVPGRVLITILQDRKKKFQREF